MGLNNIIFVRFENVEADCCEKFGDFLLQPLQRGFGYSIWDAKTNRQTQQIAACVYAIFAFTLCIIPTLVGLAMYAFSKSHSANYLKAQEFFQKAALPATPIATAPPPNSPRPDSPAAPKTPSGPAVGASPKPPATSAPSTPITPDTPATPVAISVSPPASPSPQPSPSVIKKPLDPSADSSPKTPEPPPAAAAASPPASPQLNATSDLSGKLPTINEVRKLSPGSLAVPLNQVAHTIKGLTPRGIREEDAKLFADDDGSPTNGRAAKTPSPEPDPASQKTVELEEAAKLLEEPSSPYGYSLQHQKEICYFYFHQLIGLKTPISIYDDGTKTNANAKYFKELITFLSALPDENLIEFTSVLCTVRHSNPKTQSILKSLPLDKQKLIYAHMSKEDNAHLMAKFLGTPVGSSDKDLIKKVMDLPHFVEIAKVMIRAGYIHALLGMCSSGDWNKYADTISRILKHISHDHRAKPANRELKDIDQKIQFLLRESQELFIPSCTKILYPRPAGLMNDDDEPSPADLVPHVKRLENTVNLCVYKTMLALSKYANFKEFDQFFVFGKGSPDFVLRKKMGLIIGIPDFEVRKMFFAKLFEAMTIAHCQPQEFAGITKAIGADPANTANGVLQAFAPKVSEKLKVKK